MTRIEYKLDGRTYWVELDFNAIFWVVVYVAICAVVVVGLCEAI
jgi:hypothetical protein